MSSPLPFIALSLLSRRCCLVSSALLSLGISMATPRLFMFMSAKMLFACSLSFYWRIVKREFSRFCDIGSDMIVCLLPKFVKPYLTRREPRLGPGRDFLGSNASAVIDSIFSMLSPVFLLSGVSCCCCFEFWFFFSMRAAVGEAGR